MAEQHRDAQGEGHHDQAREHDAGQDHRDASESKEFRESQRTPVTVSDTLKPPNPLPPKPKG